MSGSLGRVAGVHPARQVLVAQRTNSQVQTTGVLQYVRQQDGDDSDSVASLRHQFRLGAVVLSTLRVTAVITSPTPRFFLYSGAYNNLTEIWDSNDDYPGQALAVGTSFDYELGGLSLDAGDLLVFGAQDDASGTSISVFSWMLLGRNRESA